MFTVRGKLGSVLAPVTPGVTGAVRRCAPAPFACNTRCYRRTAPAAPGITGGPIRGHEIYCNQSECDRVQMRCNWRLERVTPGVTGEQRLCAPANGACNTRCYRRLHRSQLSTDCFWNVLYSNNSITICWNKYKSEERKIMIYAATAAM